MYLHATAVRISIYAHLRSDRARPISEVLQAQKHEAERHKAEFEVGLSNLPSHDPLSHPNL